MRKERLRRRLAAGAMAVSFGAALFGGIAVLHTDEVDWAGPGADSATVTETTASVQLSTGREESLIETDWA